MRTLILKNHHEISFDGDTVGSAGKFEFPDIVEGVFAGGDFDGPIVDLHLFVIEFSCRQREIERDVAALNPRFTGEGHRIRDRCSGKLTHPFMESEPRRLPNRDNPLMLVYLFGRHRITGLLPDPLRHLVREIPGMVENINLCSQAGNLERTVFIDDNPRRHGICHGSAQQGDGQTQFFEHDA